MKSLISIITLCFSLFILVNCSPSQQKNDCAYFVNKSKTINLRKGEEICTSIIKSPRETLKFFFHLSDKKPNSVEMSSIATRFKYSENISVPEDYIVVFIVADSRSFLTMYSDSLKTKNHLIQRKKFSRLIHTNLKTIKNYDDMVLKTVEDFYELFG